jgi:hypothetical protein
MLSGVSLALSEVPLELIARHGLGRRICDRGGEREVQFLFADSEQVLPAWRGGRLEVLRWDPGSLGGRPCLRPCGRPARTIQG